MSRRAVFALIFVTSGCGHLPKEALEAPLPDVSAIKAVHVQWIEPGGSAEKTWDVHERFSDIVDTLKPNQRAPHPARWEVAGALEIATKDGAKQRILVFAPADGSVAFKIGDTYYKGGGLAKLEAAVNVASHMKSGSP